MKIPFFKKSLVAALAFLGLTTYAVGNHPMRQPLCSDTLAFPNQKPNITIERAELVWGPISEKKSGFFVLHFDRRIRNRYGRIATPNDEPWSHAFNNSMTAEIPLDVYSELRVPYDDPTNTLLLPFTAPTNPEALNPQEKLEMLSNLPVYLELELAPLEFVTHVVRVAQLKEIDEGENLWSVTIELESPFSRITVGQVRYWIPPKNTFMSLQIQRAPEFQQDATCTSCLRYEGSIAPGPYFNILYNANGTGLPSVEELVRGLQDQRPIRIDASDGSRPWHALENPFVDEETS